MLQHHHDILHKYKKLNRSVVIEGSPEDNMIFALLSNMSIEQLNTYKRVYNKLIKERNKFAYIKIYLHINTITALKRIKERGRECEKNITIEYLNKLGLEQSCEEYDDIFVNYTLSQKEENIKSIIEML